MRRSLLYLQLAASASGLKKTALFDIHLKHKGHMAPFAGYEMPIYYDKTGIIEEHLRTRSNVGLFDVSHMGQYEIRGADRERFVEWVTPIDMQKLAVNNASLTMLMNANGGIKDDCIVTKYEDHLYIVLNAGCKDKDVAHLEDMQKEFKGDVTLIPLHKRSLLAVQGPKSCEMLSKYVSNISTMNFMESCHELTINGIKVSASRCGYTGEDGFEIGVADDDAAALANIFINDGATMVGLGARNTLRLEAGLNLYGHELNEDVNPIAAKLMWSISKRRMSEGGFIGFDKLKLFKSNPEFYIPRVKVGVKAEKGPVARENTLIEKDGKVVGNLTSGGYSPCLKRAIGLGYVDRAIAKQGVQLKLVIRNTRVDAEVTAIPFVPHKYYRK